MNLTYDSSSKLARVIRRESRRTIQVVRPEMYWRRKRYIPRPLQQGLESTSSSEGSVDVQLESKMIYLSHASRCEHEDILACTLVSRTHTNCERCLPLTLDCGLDSFFLLSSERRVAKDCKKRKPISPWTGLISH